MKIDIGYYIVLGANPTPLVEITCTYNINICYQLTFHIREIQKGLLIKFSEVG